MQIVELRLDDIDLSEATLRQVNTSCEQVVDMLLDVEARGFDHHILCRQQNGGPIYLVDGMHRLYCARQLKHETIKAEVRDITAEEANVLMVIMNQHRIPTSPMELNIHFAKAIESGKSVADLQRVYHLSKSTITNILELCNIHPDDYQYLVDKNAPSSNIYRLGKFLKTGKEISKPLLEACIVQSTTDFLATLQKTRLGLPITLMKEDKPKPRQLIALEYEIKERKKAKQLYNTPELIEAFSEGVKWACRLDDEAVEQRKLLGARKQVPTTKFRRGRIEGKEFNEH